jgi:hypothetical protein
MEQSFFIGHCSIEHVVTGAPIHMIGEPNRPMELNAPEGLENFVAKL